jgi:pentatricopeptide repeat protein
MYQTLIIFDKFQIKLIQEYHVYCNLLPTRLLRVQPGRDYAAMQHLLLATYHALCSEMRSVTQRVCISTVKQISTANKTTINISRAESNEYNYASLLQMCEDAKALEEGKQLHAQMLKSRVNIQHFMQAKLVSMYVKCGNLPSARQLFDKRPERDVLLWNAMIRASAMSGLYDEVLSLYNQMQLAGMQPDNCTFPCTLKACGRLLALQDGKRIHCHIIRYGFQADVLVSNNLVAMYSKCGTVADARKVFDKMSQRVIISWNGMIAGYSQNGCFGKALELFSQMKLSGTKPDAVTVTSVLPACAHLDALQQGKDIHDYIKRSGFDSDVFVNNALIGMYAKCRSIEDARRVFDNIYSKDVVSWSSMIAGYAQNGHGQEALKLLCDMELEGLKPNSVTIASVLPACVDLEALQRGKEIHGYIIRRAIESDVLVQNALLDMYAKCGSMEDGHRVFVRTSQRDVISWNALIAGYIKNSLCDEALKLFSQMKRTSIKPNVITWSSIIAGYAQIENADEALKLFQEMQQAGLKPNSVTIATVLPACAHFAALQHGKEIHGYVIRNGFEFIVSVVNSLIDMYAKSGNINNARDIFDKMSERDVVSWNAMIAGYGMHGLGEEALTLFHKMQHEGMKPDHITFVGILSACSHAGLVDEGWEYFHGMIHDYNIKPKVEHYACMVDLLGRAGHLDDAYEFVKKMPLEPDATLWGALLGACRVHCKVELGEHVAECLLELKPKNAGYYILLSNIYASAGRWDAIAKVRTMMKDRGLKKKPGCSWIEVKNKVHVFFVGNEMCPELEEMHATFEKSAMQMEAGYVPNTRHCTV